MKLYINPGACALASHIAVREGQLDVPVAVARRGKLEDGSDFSKINPKNYTPTLQLEDGQILTESAVVLQYLGDQAKGSGLLSAAGTLERYREMEWLNYVATEIHKGFSPFFNPRVGDWASVVRDQMGTKFDFLSKHLEGRDYLMGDRFTVADAYLYTVLRWVKDPHMELSRWPVLVAYRDRVAARPAVAQTLKEEGLS